MADISLKFGVQGEQSMKTALAAINSQISYLNADMKLAVAEMAGMSSEEEKAARQKKVLSEQTDAYRKKVSLLSENYNKQEEKLQKLKEQLDKTAESTGENSDATIKAQSAYNKQAKVVNSLGAELKKAEANLKSTENSMDALGKETEDTSKDLDKGKKSAESFWKTVGAHVTAEGAISALKKLGKTLKDLALGSIELSDDLGTQAKVTGLSTDALQEYRYMSELVDVSVDTITGSLTKLTKNMSTASKGSGDAYDAFEKLNVSFQDTNGNLRKSQDVFNDLIDALGNVENETERDSIAMTLFGKSAQDLNPLIIAGSAQIKAYAQEAHDMGYVMSSDVIEKNAAASDALERMKNSVSGAKNEIGSYFAPAIEKASGKVTTLIQKARENSETIEKLGKIIVAATSAFIAYKGAVAAMSILDKLKTATQGASIAQAALNAVMNANPIAILIAGTAALVAALVLFKKRTDETDPSIKVLQGDISKLSSELDSHASAWKSVEDARDSAIAQGNAEMKYYEGLYQELKNITDQNGKVQKGYEDRAAFITGKLSEALGIEISLQGGVIQNYQTLQAEISNTITKKKAEITLKAQEEAYIQAIRQREQAVIDLAKAETNRVSAASALSQKEAEYKALQAELTEMLKDVTDEFTTVDLRDINARISAKSEEIQELKKANDDAIASYNQAKTTIGDVTYTINQYEKNMEYAHKGEFDKISAVNAETARSYNSLSAEEKKAVDAMTGDLAAKASVLYNQSVATFMQIPKGATAGINDPSSQGAALWAMGNFANSLVNKARMTLQVQSPSKKMKEIGEYLVQGLGLGIKTEENVALRQVAALGQDTIAAFQKATRGGFDASSDQMQITSVGGSPVIQSGGKTYVIQLALDGKQIAANTTKFQTQQQKAYAL